jgi:hypothetical protein
MLIHQSFHPDITYHINENGTWESFDSVYCLRMKQHIKHQLLEKFIDIQGKNFIIHWPSGVLQKTMPLLSAIWELGGVVVVHDLQYNLQYNPMFADFYSSIDYILVETGFLKFTNLAELFGPSAHKLHEISYWDVGQVAIDNDSIIANEGNIALMVTGSGSLTAPKQTTWTHREALHGMSASKLSHHYQSDEHVLHVRALHHSSAAVWFLLATQLACKHHYYKQNQSNISHSDHLIETLADKNIPTINRVLLGTSITDEFLCKLKD